MRKIGIFLIILTIALVSCSKDDSTNPLVGTWVTSYTELGVVYTEEVTINSNNTGSGFVKEDGVLTDNYSFTWSTNNNVLTITLDGETYSEAYSISGNQLTIGDLIYTRK